jgi:NAD(P)-dependent dehydrogenase (short-subunit alcohol dehydrogenase family)
MSQKVVLVTGVAGGIGLATARCFQQQGWRVVGVDRKASHEIENEIERDAIDYYLETDVADPDAIERAIAQVADTCGSLHSLVNNAALQICKPVVETTVAEWDQVMAVNVRAAFCFAKAAYPLLNANQGSIVNVSSVHAVATSANIAAYATSKGALSALTRALAIEFAPTIRVNAILPGAVDTEMLRSGLQRGHLQGENLDALLANLGQKTIMGRVGNPEEIARAILFLADGNQSDFMTGQSLIIDGGAIARLSTE